MLFILTSTTIGVVSIGGAWLAGYSLWLGLLLSILLHVPLLLGTLHPSPSWICPTVTRGPTPNGKRVALTFDDGPTPSATPAVLHTLAKHDIRATFFCMGWAVRNHPSLVRAIADAGHEIGNHTYSHPHHAYLWSAKQLYRDIALAQKVITRYAGCSPRLFRPAVGFRSFAMARVMRELDLTLVNFSVRAYDTRVVSADQITQRIVRRTQPGAIILLHDGADRVFNPDRRAMLTALPRLIQELRKQDYDFVSVSSLLGL